MDNDTAPLILLWQLFSGKFWELAAYVLVLLLYGIVKVKITRHVSAFMEEGGDNPVANLEEGVDKFN